MKIAIVGSGISGLTAAYHLQNHEVWIFEKEDYAGGHSHTVDVEDQNGKHAIDTGFIVCNDRTYPNFLSMMSELDVKLQTTQMGFSVKAPLINLEYSGTGLHGIFAQPKNLCNHRYLKFLYEIYRFNKLALKSTRNNEQFTLGEFFKIHNISSDAQKYYILPMISAIWSARHTESLHLATRFLFKFLDNHGLLDPRHMPQWYSIVGGSREYVTKLLAKIQPKILLNNRVTNIQDTGSGVIITHTDGIHEFDRVIVAIHSSDVPALFIEPNKRILDFFGQIPYEASKVTLHTDTSILPKQQRAWASWNYLVNENTNAGPSVTYNMNILQQLRTNTTYLVSLNINHLLAPSKILMQFNYSHPIFRGNILELQAQWHDINSQNIIFCGAYWGYGFHEDGVLSGIRAAKVITQDVTCKTQSIAVT